MASFIQPGANDPAASDCQVSNFEVFCNSILPSNRRFTHWYQFVNLTLGATAILVPTVLFLIYRLIQSRRESHPKVQRIPKHTRRVSKADSEHGVPLQSFRQTKSFCIVNDHLDGDDVSFDDSRAYDLLVFPLSMQRDGRASTVPSSRASVRSSRSIVAKMNIARIDVDALGLDTFTENQMNLTVSCLVETYFQMSLAGFALRCSRRTKPESMEKLLEALCLRKVSAIILCHHDYEVLDSISFVYASGLIVENACILSNGERRDYFRARRLRETMSRCALEREERPEFFVGYLDQWKQRPHPSVIKRATKLAEHFGAVFEHGPMEAVGGVNPCVNASRTVGGFEYLRRAEIIGLQTAWTSETKKVRDSCTLPSAETADKVAQLPLNDIEKVVPGTSGLFSSKRLSPELKSIRDEVAEILEPPTYIDTLPSYMADFCDINNDGQSLSPEGCFPLTSEPHLGHYNAIVDTQAHLCQLNMLHPVEGTEEQALLATLRSMTSHPQCDASIHDLIRGLSLHEIRVYKGLDTGFRALEGNAQFWGVSKARDEVVPGSADIFVSQKSPNDAAVVLHTWLAHLDRPRIQRFEQELLLEQVNGVEDDSGLPLSIRTAIRQATAPELLNLVQKFRLSNSSHFLVDPVKRFSRSILIDETTKAAWRNTCARGVLDGSVSMRELLRLRLEHHVRQGAEQVPDVNNLLRLHDLVEQVIIDALFFGKRSTVHALAKALMHCYNSADHEYVDVAADMFALIFFSILRRAAFEDVYLESTDRCPLFLPQPDQAAVFSELWVLGSQCENYFSLAPRDIGEIIYDRYNRSLEARPPTAEDRKNNEIMTMYSSVESDSGSEDANKKDAAESSASLTPHEWAQVWKQRFASASAMSIFCLPAIIDVLLLTFLGRGLFMTAFMASDHVEAAGYALLTSLLLTAGVTGWVGSTGNYYLPHYAYHNMIYFHVQRLSGGFILALLVSVCGIIGFGLRVSPAVGFLFAAYLMCVSTYLNLLGIMSTMHQHNSPLSSGRNVFLQSFPLLFISPIVSSFVPGHDLEIYLPVMYAFLVLTLYRYRRLCQEWANWMNNIPAFSAKHILEWYTAKLESESTSDVSVTTEKGSEQSKMAEDAQDAFVAAVVAFNRRSRDAATSKLLSDPLVSRVAKGLPYIDWLFKKAGMDGDIPELFSTAWFTKLGDAINQQRQLSRGLKDHNILVLFRFARYDLGQNLGLFLVALMDRWVMLVMSARQPYPSIYTDSRARYGFCFSIIYFCLAAMLLDTALYKYWGIRDNLSNENLRDLEHAKRIADDAEKQRKKAIVKALTDILGKTFVVFGAATIFLWLFVESRETVILYYCYVFGYTCAIIFQFNRCFTTSVVMHVKIILYSAAVGFIVGCLLHALPWTADFLYSDVIAQNTAAALAAIGTSLWAWKDWSSSPSLLSPGHSTGDAEDALVFSQHKLLVKSTAGDHISKKDLPEGFTRPTIWHQDGTGTTRQIYDLLCLGQAEPNKTSQKARWSEGLFETVLDKWRAGRLTAAVLSPEHFAEAGLQDLASLSLSENDVLHVAVCFTSQFSSSIQHGQQPPLARLVAEALLYHVALSEMKLSAAQAMQAEHMLPNTETLSQRIQAEIVSAGRNSSGLLTRRAKMELMKQLCLDVDVDVQWESIPQSAREVILGRVVGQQSYITNEFVMWASTAGVELQTVDFHVELALEIYRKSVDLSGQAASISKKALEAGYQLPSELKAINIRHRRGEQSFLRSIPGRINRVAFLVVKWIAIITGGDSNIERELAYCLRTIYLRSFILRLILLVWKVCWIVKNFWVYWLLIYNRPAIVKIMRLASKGARRKISKGSIVVELTRSSVTGFASANDNGTMDLQVFNGTPTEVPEEGTALFVATYDENCRLKNRVDIGTSTSSYQYNADSRSRCPVSKEVVNKEFCSVGYYDKHGRIVRGDLTIGDTKLDFRYHYNSTHKGNLDVLRADFKLTGTEDTLSVFWGKPINTEEYTWVPSKNVGLIIRKIAGKTYTTEYDYQHRRDPTITVFLEEGGGRRTAMTKAPQMFGHERILLAAPKNHTFESDDLLFYHSPFQIRQMHRYSDRGKRPGFISHLNPFNWVAQWNKRVYSQLPTWRVRTELWNKWLKTNDLDAVTACWVDELVLREEPSLKEYWRARESGRLEDAKRALDDRIGQIVSSIDIETDVSEVTLLSIKTADLYAMGLGKDANPVTTRPQDCYNDTHDRVSVIFNDIGCWPVAPGGVSNCRRDLVNGHSTIRNHVLAECANDYGIPRFQIEKSVQSLKLLPLWGLDGGTANHGIIDNLLESQVDEKVDDTDVQHDIVSTFVPLLVEFVKGARMKRHSRADLVRLSNVLLSMAKYYEHKDYTRTWKSPEVEQAWVAAWLRPYNDDPNIRAPSESFDILRPSMFDFRQSLYIYLAYFFIFAVGVPEQCPRVFQSTHHGISSLFGMVLKYNRGVTVGIWDHAILWRESCLNISPAQSELPVPVQSMLLAGIGLATRLAYFHADVVMPCASLFNPMWEAEIGADGSKLCSRNLFRRKIDPVVNGISNMDAYKPVDKVRTDVPTVVMLSNVQFIKGVKAAIQAADIIINRFGFSDYQLVVYGAKDRQPAYALEMEKLIVENNLSGKVVLAGFGNSREVLKDAWLFMNSSISEGLPLAIGEAALAGVPIVATEVGATALVLTDPEKPDQRYGEVVPPNDPLALARAQISMLSMVGAWAKFTDHDAEKAAEAPVLPDEITPEDVKWLTRRFYERSDDRRKLGLLSRQVVLHSFHGSRYLREHEQMYWIQWHLSKMNDNPILMPLPFQFGRSEPLRYVKRGTNSAIRRKKSFIYRTMSFRRRNTNNGVDVEKGIPAT